jgi:polyadenylate-binding protein
MIMDKPIYVALAQKKEERRQQLSVNQAQNNMNHLRTPNSQNAMMPPVFPTAMAPFAAAPSQPAPNFFSNQVMQGFISGNPAGAIPAPGTAPGGFDPRQAINAHPAAFTGQQNLFSGGNQASGASINAMQRFWANRPTSNVRPAMMTNPSASIAAQQQLIFNAQQRMQMSQRAMPPQSMVVPQYPNRAALASQIPCRPQTVSRPPQTAPQVTDIGPPLSREHLATLSGEEKRQVLGERLYRMLHDYVGAEYIGKVTGMLLGSDERDLFEMLTSTDHSLLYQKADEAKRLHIKHQAETANNHTPN